MKFLFGVVVFIAGVAFVIHVYDFVNGFLVGPYNSYLPVVQQINMNL